MPEQFREIQLIGGDTPERIVPGGSCGAMDTYQLHLAGLSDAGRGYRIGRERPAYAQVMVCTGGQGRVWVKDRFVTMGAGEAYLSPAGVPCAMRTVPGHRWRFCWVHYLEPIGRPALVVGEGSWLVKTDGWFLETAVLGLYREWVRGADGPTLDRWVELIQSYVARLVLPVSGVSLLRDLWEQVDRRLDEPWSLQRLAGVAGMSIEALRQHSRRDTGRSPMAHVTQLRLSRASVLLQTTGQPIAEIAVGVGYANEAAFSTAFKRVIGVPPSAYRRASQRPRRER